MKLKTSTTIALKFSIYVMLLLILFGIGINIGSFTQWYKVENNRLEEGVDIRRPVKRFLQMRPGILVVPSTQDIESELTKHKIRKTISKFDDEFIIYKKDNNNNIKISNISHLIDMQKELFITTLLVIFSGGILTFIISRVFIISSFKKINELVSFVKNIDIHNLDKPVPLSGPEDDEIRIIAQSIKDSLSIIRTQTDSLKDFVSYASHELKTPLATIHGLIDLGIKKNTITTVGPKIKKTLTNMNTLLDSLVQITKREFSNLHNTKVDLIPLIQEIIETTSKQFTEKEIKLYLTLPKSHIISGKSDIISIIISNILHNAYKFTKEKNKIHIHIENNTLTIQDNGVGISQEDQPKIRTRFWKKHTENNTGYGLGLYMVKLLTEKLGRKISLESEQNHGSKFILTMK